MKKNLITKILAVLLLASLLTACGKGSYTAKEQEPVYYDQAGFSEEVNYSASKTGSSKYDEDPVISDKKTAESVDSAESGRKLIKTMSFSLESKEFDQAIAVIKQLTAAAGGYIESSSIGGKGSAGSIRYASFTLRIPVGELSDFAEEMSKAGNVTQSSEQVKDITLGYTDTASRLKALETQRDSLIAMMAKAEKLEDLLTIQDKLTEVERQLEYQASMLRLYDNQVEYSSVSISLREVRDYSEPEPESFWERLTASFKASLKDAGEFLENSVIFIVGNLPTLLIWAVIITVVVLVLRKCIKKKKAKKAARAAAAQQTLTPPQG